MNIEAIDHWCDKYESSLKSGHLQQVDEFVSLNELPQDKKLIAELRQLYEHYAAQETANFDRSIASTINRQAGATSANKGDAKTEDASPETIDQPKKSGKRKALPSNLHIEGYEIEGVLGKGGMGVVYQARQIAADRLVALKVILGADEAGTEELERFRIEAKASAQLQHPNIVQLFEVGESDGLPYFTLEYVRGGTLSRLLRDKLPTPEETAKYMVALSRAIAYAHEKGIVHRDLKPANILISEDDGALKVADFGLARRSEDDSTLTRDGSVLGTPSYMAPEQASGSTSEIGPKSDVYSLGAILYELLTGRPPFKGTNVWEVINLVRKEPPTPPSEFQRSTPPDLETICLKCLEKSPDQRYASAENLAADLQRFLNNEPILARPTSRWEKFVRLCQRHPRETGLAGLAAGLLVMVACISTWSAVTVSAQNEEIRIQNTEIKSQNEAIKSQNLEITSKSQKIEQQNIEITETNRMLEDEIVRSESRLQTTKLTTREFVNQAFHYTQDVPLTGELRRQLAALIEHLYEIEVDEAELGPSRDWAIGGADFRKAETSLREISAAVAAFNISKESLEQRVSEALTHVDAAQNRFAQVVESGEGDEAKGKANLAAAIEIRASLLQFTDKEQAKLFFDKAIEMRDQISQLSDGEEPQARRIAELGKSYAKRAEFRFNIARTAPEYLAAIKDFDVALASIQEGLAGLPESAYIRRKFARDLASTALNKAELYSKVSKKTENIEAFLQLARQKANYLISNGIPSVADVNLFMKVENSFGDFLITRLQQPDLAQVSYRQSRKQVVNLLNDGELRELLGAGLAMNEYRRGLAFLMTNDSESALASFGRCALVRKLELELDKERLGFDSPDLDSEEADDQLLYPRMNLMLAQARAGESEEAVTEARRVIERAGRSAESPVEGYATADLYLQAAAGLSLASEHLKSEVKRNELLVEAVDAMKKSVRSGFNDIVYLENDPDLSVLKKAENYPELIALFEEVNAQ